LRRRISQRLFGLLIDSSRKTIPKDDKRQHKSAMLLLGRPDVVEEGVASPLLGTHSVKPLIHDVHSRTRLQYKFAIQVLDELLTQPPRKIIRVEKHNIWECFSRKRADSLQSGHLS
jgi:hypothetical protein